jgi:hypothetical protein
MFKFDTPQQPPTPEELKADITAAMLDMTGLMEPIYDTADGMKRDLEARGWSPTMAEQVAGSWLCAAMAAIGGGGK